MTGSIKEKLLGCPSIKSLRDETSIAKTLSSLGWHSTVGPVYFDVSTNKLREVDVRARRSWVTKSENPIQVNVQLLCETKTMSGYHIIFADSPSQTPKSLLAMSYAVWAGNFGRENQDIMLESFTRAGIEQDSADRLIDSFRQISYPDGFERVQPFKTAPPDVPYSATTFKETSVDKEKELDNSVLWRASLVLNSVMESCRKHFDEETKLEFEFAAKHGVMNNSFIETFAGAYQRRVSGLKLFHPVIVLDASLWMTSGDDIIETSCCRLIQRSATDDAVLWYDVVTRDGFADYAKSVTEYYDNKFIRAGGEASSDVDEILSGIL